MVQTSLGSAPREWVEGNQYQPLMWAGPSLLLGFDRSQLRVADSPGAPEGIPDLVPRAHEKLDVTTVVALNPTGDSALLDVQELTHGYMHEVINLIDVPDRRVVSKLRMPGSATGLYDDGYWWGNRIVAANATITAGSKSPPGLLIFGVDGDRVRLLSRYGFTQDGHPIPAQNLPSVGQPRFLTSFHQVGLWGTELPVLGAGYITCNLRRQRCKEGPTVSRKAFDLGAGFVSNPSRP
jgi:hypothetical protein